jgi:2'-hydroxyisoflavone reductase
MRRRTFVFALTLGGLARSPSILARGNRSLRVLVLGGTNFLGPAIVNRLLAQKHAVTLFNRGKTNPELFSHIELIRGDRQQDSDAGLSGLKGTRRWDAVIDVWPDSPHIVGPTARLLKDRVGYYHFISTIGAYAPSPQYVKAEDAPLRAESTGYGGGKAECERLLERVYGQRSGRVRPGVIKGDRDPGLDMYYWLLKVNRPAPYLAPGDGQDPLQLVDVHDVANFVVDSVETKRPGAFNITSPVYTWSGALDEARSAIAGRGTPVWASAEFLAAHSVSQFENMPIWKSRNGARPASIFPSDKAFALGWKPRPLTRLLTDLWTWYRQAHPAPVNFPVTQYGFEFGISEERERDLLAELDSRGRV